MGNCVFCDRNQFEERLVFEDHAFYVIATLGQITDGGYVLLAPKNHVRCMAELSPELNREALALGFKICKSISAEYGREAPKNGPYPITAFEHGIVGQTVGHAHLHFLPTVLDITPVVRKDFPTAEVETLHSAGRLRDAYGEHPEPYLYWTNASGSGVVAWNPPAPLQYLRKVTADLLGRPERANWRTMNPELDRGFWSETVVRLKPYFL